MLMEWSSRIGASRRIAISGNGDGDDSSIQYTDGVTKLALRRQTYCTRMEDERQNTLSIRLEGVSAMYLKEAHWPHGVAQPTVIEIPLKGQVETMSLLRTKALLSFDDQAKRRTNYNAG